MTGRPTNQNVKTLIQNWRNRRSFWIAGFLLCKANLLPLNTGAHTATSLHLCICSQAD